MELGAVMLGLEEAQRLLRELREGAEQQASVVCVLECAHGQDAHACVWADWAGLYRRRGGARRRGCSPRRGTWHLGRWGVSMVHVSCCVCEWRVGLEEE